MSSNGKIILKELRKLKKENLPGIGIDFACEQNFNVVDVSMEINLNIRGIIIFLLRIELPNEWPDKAPVVSFCIDFGYTNGSTMIHENPDYPLYGGISICNDALTGGFFGAVHQEWGSTGSGYRQQGGLTELLVQIQSILVDTIEHLNDQQFTSFEHRLKVFKEQQQKKEAAVEEDPTLLDKKPWYVWSCPDIPNSIATLPAGSSSSDEVKDLQDLSLNESQEVSPGDRKDVSFENLTAGDIFLLIKNNKEKKKELLQLLIEDAKIPLPDIKCCKSDASLIENPNDIFGYLINCQTKWIRGKVQLDISTEGSLISFSKFNLMKSMGRITTSTNNVATHFIPIYIHQDHSDRIEWMSSLRINLESIISITGGGLEIICIEVFSNLINTLLIDLFKPHSDKSISIRYFESLLHLWRTFYYIMVDKPSVGALLNQRISDFYSNPNNRHKKETPDMGKFMILTSLVQFNTNLYVFIFEETIMRTIMWTMKNNPNNRFTNINDIFRDTSQISLDMIYFHSLFKEVVFNSSTNKDVINKLDESCCQCPELLEIMLQKFKEYKRSVENWSQYLEAINYPVDKREIILNNSTTNNWFLQLKKKSESIQSYYFSRRY